LEKDFNRSLQEAADLKGGEGLESGGDSKEGSKEDSKADSKAADQDLEHAARAARLAVKAAQAQGTDQQEADKAIHTILLDCNSKLRDLNKSLSDASVYLAPYDSRHARQVIERLRTAKEYTRNALVPRKKFAFKVRAVAEPWQSRGAWGRVGGAGGVLPPTRVAYFINPSFAFALCE
jgi:hypothetical protein